MNEGLNMEMINMKLYDILFYFLKLSLCPICRNQHKAGAGISLHSGISSHFRSHKTLLLSKP